MLRLSRLHCPVLLPACGLPRALTDVMRALCFLGPGLAPASPIPSPFPPLSPLPVYRQGTTSQFP